MLKTKTNMGKYQEPRLLQLMPAVNFIPHQLILFSLLSKILINHHLRKMNITVIHVIEALFEYVALNKNT